MLLKVRLASHEAIGADADRVARALEERGLKVEHVGANAAAELRLSSGVEVGRLAWDDIAAVIELPEPRDIVVTFDEGSTGLTSIPEGASVGVSGRLRREMLGVHRPDLRAVGIDDGYVVVGLLDQREIAAWIAPIGEVRMAGLADDMKEVLVPTSWATEVGRGMLILEARGTSRAVMEHVASLDEPGARGALAAELEVSRRLGASSDAPLGVLARAHGRSLRLRALVPSARGQRLVRAEVSGKLLDPSEAARRIAERLLARGAAELLEPEVRE